MRVQVTVTFFVEASSEQPDNVMDFENMCGEAVDHVMDSLQNAENEGAWAEEVKWAQVDVITAGAGSEAWQHLQPVTTYPGIGFHQVD